MRSNAAVAEDGGAPGFERRAYNKQTPLCKFCFILLYLGQYELSVLIDFVQRCRWQRKCSLYEGETNGP